MKINKCDATQRFVRVYEYRSRKKIKSIEIRARIFILDCSKSHTDTQLMHCQGPVPDNVIVTTRILAH